MDKFNTLCKNLKLNTKNNYLIINNFTNEDAFLDRLASSLNNGTDFVEFNPTFHTTQNAIRIGRKIQQLCKEFDATFVVTERADIAYTLDADGIVLTMNSFTPQQAKDILGENALIGITCTTKEEVVSAQNWDIDFIKTLNFVNTNEKISKKIFSQVLELNI